MWTSIPITKTLMMKTSLTGDLTGGIFLDSQCLEGQDLVVRTTDLWLVALPLRPMKLLAPITTRVRRKPSKSKKPRRRLRIGGHKTHINSGLFSKIFSKMRGLLGIGLLVLVLGTN